jgi:SNF family Na+-dependent transporter
MDKLVIYILIIAALSLGLTMLSLIDILKKDFGSSKKKVLWHFVALIPLFGWLLYLIFGFKKGKKKPD